MRSCFVKPMGFSPRIDWIMNVRRQINVGVWCVLVVSHHHGLIVRSRGSDVGVPMNYVTTHSLTCVIAKRSDAAKRSAALRCDEALRSEADATDDASECALQIDAQ